MNFVFARTGAERVHRRAVSERRPHARAAQACEFIGGFPRTLIVNHGQEARIDSIRAGADAPDASACEVCDAGLARAVGADLF